MFLLSLLNAPFHLSEMLLFHVFIWVVCDPKWGDGEGEGETTLWDLSIQINRLMRRHCFQSNMTNGEECVRFNWKQRRLIWIRNNLQPWKNKNEFRSEHSFSLSRNHKFFRLFTSIREEKDNNWVRWSHNSFLLFVTSSWIPHFLNKSGCSHRCSIRIFIEHYLFIINYSHLFITTQPS